MGENICVCISFLTCKKCHRHSYFEYDQRTIAKFYVICSLIVGAIFYIHVNSNTNNICFYK